MKVSIIIPYNEDRGYLNQAIESCKDQDDMVLDKDYEIILQHGNYGVSKNINDAVKKARGEFIKLCAEDDIMTTNCLHALYSKAIEGYDFVCANALTISTDEEYKGYWNSHIPETISELASTNTINGGTVLYRKSAMPEWDETMWTAEEYDLCLRMADAGCRFGYTPDIVYCYRIWRGQKSGVCRTKTNAETFRSNYINEFRKKYLDNHKKIVR